jgi:superfamily II DNA or RNA helicase
MMSEARPGVSSSKSSRRFFTHKERVALLTVSGGRCEICGQPLTGKFHADHIKAYARGGATDLSNAQALCMSCNLKKGAGEVLPEPPQFYLRDWQADCLEEVTARYVAGLTDFLAVACPGAGKTTMALAFATQQLRFNFIIVVVPSTDLKHQWMEAAGEAGLKFRSDMLNNHLDLGPPEDIDGLCVTYHQVNSNPQVQALLCARKRVLAILDEVHHAGEEKKWGDNLVESFKNASFRLLLSGTPFRSDNCKIPFVRYDEDGLSKPDYKYGYGAAVRDGVCRAIVFPHYEGKMEWLDGGEIMSASFADDLNRRGESRRLLTALSTKGMLLKAMLWNAHEKLMSLRATGEGQHADAGGLVVAMDKDHALAIANIMRRDLKIDPVVVYFDDPTSHDKIKAFRKSNQPWIIAINMISEGVDIPRLRVGVYASNKITLLFFRQVIGRLVRMIAGLDEQTAYFYLPKDARLVEMALDIRNEVNHALLEKDSDSPGGPEEPEDPEGPEGPDDPRNIFVPIDSDGEEDGHIAGELAFPIEELQHVREIQRQQPEFKIVPETSIALLLRKYTGFPTPEAPEPTPPSAPLVRAAAIPVNPNQENKKLRARSNALATSVAVAMNPYDPDWKTPNRIANARAGIRNIHAATKAQLEMKIEVLKELLKQHGGEDPGE